MSSARCIALALLSVTVWALPLGVARAHPMQLGVLTLTEQAPGTFDVHFRFSGSESAPDRGAVVLPAQCTPTGPRRRAPIAEGFDESFRIVCGAAGLRGLLGAEGLTDSSAQVLLRVAHGDGRVEQHLLDESTPFVELGPTGEPAAAVQEARSSIFVAYLALGVEHIAFGFDHLLFVLGLVLLVVRWRPLVATITAFTVGHSITLALATLGLVGVPTAPVEACIALSILLLAVELAHPERAASLTRSMPWLVAAGFGLLHGVGFAGALAEVGLPEGELPLALLAFNLGVEAGQLAFVLVVVAARRVLQRRALPEPARWIAPYAIGTLSAYWVIERVAAFGG